MVPLQNKIQGKLKWLRKVTAASLFMFVPLANRYSNLPVSAFSSKVAVSCSNLLNFIHRFFAAYLCCPQLAKYVIAHLEYYTQVTIW